MRLEEVSSGGSLQNNSGSLLPELLEKDCQSDRLETAIGTPHTQKAKP
jgi:hypothetical protein